MHGISFRNTLNVARLDFFIWASFIENGCGVSQDVDGDGMLTETELQRGIQDMGITLSASLVKVQKLNLSSTLISVL